LAGDPHWTICRLFQDYGKGGDGFAILRDNSKEMIPGTAICLLKYANDIGDAESHGEQGNRQHLFTWISQGKK